MERDFGDLVIRLRGRFSQGIDDPWPEVEFGDLAFEAFQYQFGRNAIYRAYCQGRGATPQSVTRWQEVPPVPTSAFKSVPLISGDPERVEAEFRTSGTTLGSESRGVHRIPNLSLYDASLLPNFQAHLLPDGRRLPFLSLIPRPDRVPDSSLSHMVGVADRVWGAPGGGWFMDPELGLDSEGFLHALERVEAAGGAVLVVGTAFAFVHWLDSAEARRWSGALPAGSRDMARGVENRRIGARSGRGGCGRRRA